MALLALKDVPVLRFHLKRTDVTHNRIAAVQQIT